MKLIHVSIYVCLFSSYSYLVFSLTGRTALHWAAAVNHVDAVMTLLRNNANRDVQDNKVGMQVSLPLSEITFVVGGGRQDSNCFKYFGISNFLDLIVTRVLKRIYDVDNNW